MDKKRIVLETDRLILKDFEKDDWQKVHEYDSDLEVVSYLPFGPNTEQDSKDYVELKIAEQKDEPRGGYDLALVIKGDNRLIGACGIYVRNWQNKEAEVNYIINHHFWGKGYATEAARCLVAFGFKELGMHRIYARCDPHNRASSRVLKKIGMKREGQMREHRFAKGRWWDDLLYAILEQEWADRRKTSKF